MKPKCLLSVAVCSSLLAASGPAGQSGSQPINSSAGRAVKQPAEPAARALTLDLAVPEAPVARVVSYSESGVILVKTKTRFTTLIVLPKGETILDFTCGDKEFWVVNGSQNFAYVKPARVGAQTNLNLVTASGNVYTFLLSEVSETPKAEPDLKVFVELKDDRMAAATREAPRFISADAVETYKEQLEKARDDLRQAKEGETAAINQGINRFVSNMRFPYRFEAGKKPFSVRAMYHDDRFTYIQARPEETPTLYETKDGQPNLVSFDYKDGVYVVGKILDRGYLVIGKQKLPFVREE
jgi:type IV secretion system protein VirB9